MGSSARIAAGKGRPFCASPLLATALPAWRSRLVLFVLFAAFTALEVAPDAPLSDIIPLVDEGQEAS